MPQITAAKKTGVPAPGSPLFVSDSLPYLCARRFLEDSETVDEVKIELQRPYDGDLFDLLRREGRIA
jgi:hypothetical protein